MEIVLEEVPFGGEKYRRLLALRDEILRRPLGLAVSELDTATEDREFHLGAFVDGAVIGCVLLRPLDSATLKLRQMAVAPGHQGQGVGARLVRYAEDLARARGYTVIQMHARKTACSFYEKLGYTVVGDEYIEVTVPHFTMRKRLVG